VVANDAEHFLEVTGVGGSYSEDSVGLTCHRVRLGNLWNRADHLAHPVWRHSALAVDLDEGLDRPAECSRFDVGREAPDNAAETQPIDPSFGRRCGQPDVVPEHGEALPTVVCEPRKDLVIDVVKTQYSLLTFVDPLSHLRPLEPYPSRVASTVLNHVGHPVRRAKRRHYLMCPPTYFDVAYSINPWMKPGGPVDRALAVRQWSGLVDAYRATGHRVDLLKPLAGLPDMVYAANGATVVDGRTLLARFAGSEREAEAAIHAAWHRRNGILYGGGEVQPAAAVNEAEGDFAVLSSRILAGQGFRTTPEAHREIAKLTGREVVSLELIDPHLFHLDLALVVLDDERDHIAYYPDAFSEQSRQLLSELFPDALIANQHDAYAFGLNAVSDGLHVFISAGARQLREDLAAAGYWPISIDLSELIKGGGSVKCCTHEIRRAPVRARATSVGVAPLLSGLTSRADSALRLRASEEDSSFQRDVREDHQKKGASS
jgi:N-dimethylarginine dimethylaminohydrolase